VAIQHCTYGTIELDVRHPSRQFPITLKVKIALEILVITNHRYFVHCRKKKLLAFPGESSIDFSSAFGEIIPVLVILKVTVTFDVCSDKSTR
jgi:hypothetical protein